MSSLAADGATPVAAGSAGSPAAPLILVVEDDPQIRAALRTVLEELGARVVEAVNGREAVSLLGRESPDLIVLDLGLPDIQGDEVCRAVRAASGAPVLVVSARDSEQEKVRLLDAGADDYLTKPFGSAEFAARVRAQLRRGQRAEDGARGSIRIGDVELDVVERAATRDGRPVHLTPIEWGILRTLVRAPGRTFTHRQLFDAVWGREFGDATQYLRVHVTNLRRKVEPEPSLPAFIVTEPGVGYRLELPR